MEPNDIVARLDLAPMGRAQKLAVGIAIVLNILDGFDVLAISFAAPGIAADWRIAPAQIGVILSAGLVGMAIGALLLAPLADRIGRRPSMLLCLALMTVGMLASAASFSVVTLALCRILTGIGIGAMLPTATAAGAEYANARRRDLVVCILAVGYPLGGLFGGLASAELMSTFGWRAILAFGGIASAVTIPLVILGMPESIQYLVTHRGPGALERVNGVLVKLGHTPVDSLPRAANATPRANVIELMRSPIRNVTLQLTLSYFLVMLTFYFFSGWLPSIVASRSFEASVAIRLSAIFSVGGVVGGVCIGYLAQMIAMKALVAFFLIATTGMLCVFSGIPNELGLMIASSFVLGLFLFGAVTGFYAIFMQRFPTAFRATATGFATGIGRGGAVVGPLIGGLLLGLGFSAGQSIMVIAPAAALSALLLFAVRPPAAEAALAASRA
ncbi:MFS transporter [Sphingobium sp. B2]|uniref:MFS transporter n=1 Tax=Sphingobium sp. B2 TaxID=2583228 RepID=UPI001643E6EF|nr:MFS transporter [Sphingobium sp. B2]